MVELDTDIERVDGLTFVRATVHNTRGTDQIIRVKSRLDGPVWPPRVGDVPKPEWQGDSWISHVPSGRIRGFGFATPADPVDPPVAIADAERAPSEEYETIDQVIADLDGWSPPSNVMGDVKGDRP